MCAGAGAGEAGRESTRRRRETERGVLHGVLREHLETFLARASLDGMQRSLPRHVERELRGYLGCGILASGFARVRCRRCGKDELVAFSCKGRGFCPSCGGRRMAETAAHLVDAVLPEVAVRQWVLSFPWSIRWLIARDARLCRRVRKVFLRAVFASYQRRAEREGVAAGCSGAVCFQQRFGSALNLNPHFHALVLDGVYATSRSNPLAEPVFHELAPPDIEELSRLVRDVRDRVLRVLQKRGLFTPEHELAPAPAEDEASLFSFLSAASIQGRGALEPEEGPAQLRLGGGEAPKDPFAPGALCAQESGFSLHASVRIGAADRDRLEHLCRYVARPPLAAERLSLAPDGRVVYELRRPWRDGTTHVSFAPLTFLERLAALVPHPRSHLVTYHGILASAASHREDVVPENPGKGLASGTGGSGATEPRSERSRRYSWSELLKRVFGIDVLRCPCGGRRELIALITEPEVIRRILSHLGLSAEAPELAPARDPPQLELGF